MRRRLYFSVLLLLLCFSKAWAQQVDSSRFFPLDVGNAWTYFKVLDPPYAPPDTIWRGTFTVSETMAINDTLYYLAAYPFALADTLRADEQGRIWARVRARDVLLFDFSLAEGGSYTFAPSHAPEHTFEVTIKRNLTVDVGAGRFEDCVELRFDVPNTVDEQHTFAFALGVGIVYAYGTLGDYAALYSAEVNGQMITTIEREALLPLAPSAAFAYPNPFSTSVTIVLPLSQRFWTRVSVYDVLGRKVATLLDGHCGSGPCALTWNASGLPRGAYYARIEQGGQVQTITLLLGR